MKLLTYLLEQTARWAFVFPQERSLQRAIASAFSILCSQPIRLPVQPVKVRRW